MGVKNILGRVGEFWHFLFMPLYIAVFGAFLRELGFPITLWGGWEARSDKDAMGNDQDESGTPHS